MFAKSGSLQTVRSPSQRAASGTVLKHRGEITAENMGCAAAMRNET
jgi:anthranilate phosphoribosyltransferase